MHSQTNAQGFNGSQRAVLAKVAKALKRTEDRGCTPEEARSAAELVQRLLQEHNLTLSMVGDDNQGESKAPFAKREKRRLERRAMYGYQVQLMAALAEGHFCLHRVQVVRESQTTTWVDNGVDRATRRHVLVGREVNVDVTVSMYDCLLRALTREASNGGYDVRTRDGKTFLDAAVERVAERLRERRRCAEEESRRSAAEPRGNGTHRELILFEDVYGSEGDLNNDELNGYPPGTTAQRRRDRGAERARQEARREELVAAGYDHTVATYMSWGYDEAAAVRIANPEPSSGSGRRHRGRGWTGADAERVRRRGSSAFRDGTNAGNRIGLDDQVGASERRRIT